MKERPILFKDEMVLAILEGQKTQTRRVCKHQPYSNGIAFDGNEFLCNNDYLPPSAMLMDVFKGGKYLYATSNMEGWESECPYGQPGDRLWVREAHWFFKDEPDPITGYFPPPLTIEDVQYRADRGDSFNIWRPSIHMPRWASRITLEITGVRVEKLQDITEENAKAEGADCLIWNGIHGTSVDLIDWPLKEVGNPHRNGFAVLWESIYGHGSWNANPWVWVVDFKRVQS